MGQEESKMYCQYCGRESNGEDKYCAKCGKELVNVDFGKNRAEYQTGIRNRRDRRKRKLLIIAAAVVILVCAAIWAVIITLGKEKPIEIKPVEEVSAAQPTVHHPEDQWKQNILMSSEVNASIPLGGFRGSEVEGLLAFDTGLRRSEISRVIFEDSVEQVPKDNWDVSLA